MKNDTVYNLNKTTLTITNKDIKDVIRQGIKENQIIEGKTIKKILDSKNHLTSLRVAVTENFWLSFESVVHRYAIEKMADLKEKETTKLKV